VSVANVEMQSARQIAGHTSRTVEKRTQGESVYATGTNSGATRGQSSRDSGLAESEQLRSSTTTSQPSGSPAPPPLKHSGVGENVGTDVGASVVGTAVGTAVVGVAVGALLGTAVGTCEGAADVGATVGWLVGDCCPTNPSSSRVTQASSASVLVPLSARWPTYVRQLVDAAPQSCSAPPSGTATAAALSMATKKCCPSPRTTTECTAPSFTGAATASERCCCTALVPTWMAHSSAAEPVGATRTARYTNPEAFVLAKR
jgi:hypothetical protein